MKYFYSYLIQIESLVIELDKMSLSDEEKMHLSNLLDSSLHHTILDAVLSELSEEDKRIFLNHLEKDDHTKIWQFLKKRVDNIEDKIKKAADSLMEELHKDIKKARRKSL